MSLSLSLFYGKKYILVFSDNNLLRDFNTQSLKRAELPKYPTMLLTDILP